jgi:hypothetical protein
MEGISTKPGFLVYCDVNEEGYFKEILAGFNVIPNRQYDYFFYLEEYVDLMDCKVDLPNKKIVPK